MSLTERLTAFARDKKFRTKGPLCVALVVTDHARMMGLPLDAAALVTEKEGQVLGLGKARVQAILARHGLTRVLAEEGGRTSRGSLANMRDYVACLNAAHAAAEIDLDAAEAFWIGRVQAFFAGKPFTFRIDGQSGMRASIRHLMVQAEARQRENAGTMFAGTVMQHLTGAVLETMLGAGAVDHNGSNTNDQGPGRTGDFDIGDTVIHVSTAPGEALIRKCAANLAGNCRPVIITTRRGVTIAGGLADNAGIGHRIDIFEFEQFVATKILEVSAFRSVERTDCIRAILAIYNRIVDEFETDPSLRIEVA